MPWFMFMVMENGGGGGWKVEVEVVGIVRVLSVRRRTSVLDVVSAVKHKLATDRRMG